MPADADLRGAPSTRWLSAGDKALGALLEKHSNGSIQIVHFVLESALESGSAPLRGGPELSQHQRRSGFGSLSREGRGCVQGRHDRWG